MSPRTVPPADEMLNPEEGREPPGPPPDEAGKRSNPGLAWPAPANRPRRRRGPTV